MNLFLEQLELELEPSVKPRFVLVTNPTLRTNQLPRSTFRNTKIGINTNNRISD